MTLRAARHFFILGAAKAGTTSLHAWLAQHPGIRMSDPKEPFFFEAEYEKGPDYYHNTYFHGATDQLLLGDARHRNLYFPFIPKRIYELFPQARLLVVLRNPVDRAYAHWWHWYRLGREALPFSAAIEADHARIRAGVTVSTPAEIEAYRKQLDPDGMGPYRTYLDSGYYADQLERYFQLFPAQNIMILLFEDLISDPRGTIQSAFEFLGLDTAPVTGMDFSAKNSSGRLRWRVARKKILERLLYALRCQPASLFSRGGWKKLLARPPMEPDTRRWLESHFRSHNDRLRVLLSRELTGWS